MLEVARNLKLILWWQIIFSSINGSQKCIQFTQNYTIASLIPDSQLNIKHDKCSPISEQMTESGSF